MSKVSRSSVIALCAVLAACADSATNPQVTATGPALRSSISEASADLAVAYTLDGPFEIALPSEDAATQQAAATIAAAASGSRASGHVGFPTGWPNTGISSEKYSFTALTTDLATLAAKGQFEVQYTAPTGSVMIHGDVVCMNTFSGNTSRVVGQITKVWRNGVPSPITANTHAFWVVVDQGEGQPAPPDLVSLVRFSNVAVAQTYCATGFLSFVAPNQEGNVQVQP
jgi:hypothetical protein